MKARAGLLLHLLNIIANKIKPKGSLQTSFFSYSKLRFHENTVLYSGPCIQTLLLMCHQICLQLLWSGKGKKTSAVRWMFTCISASRSGIGPKCCRIWLWKRIFRFWNQTRACSYTSSCSSWRPSSSSLSSTWSEISKFNNT